MFLPVSLWSFLTSCSHLSHATERLDSLRGVLVWEVLLLSLATEWLDSLRGVLVWEVLLLSLATEWLDGLRGVLVWEVLLCYHLQQSGWMV